MADRRRYLWLLILGCVLATAADARATSLASFGRCLKSKGAVFYGASWCPHCHAQRATLGDAMEYVNYVECAVDGSRETTAACRAAKVNSYPTWKFADGSKESGEQSLSELAAKTGCELPAGAGAGPAPANAPKSTRPKMINVP